MTRNDTITMSHRFRARVLAGALLVATCAVAPAQAAELKLLAPAALQTVFNTVAGDFERASGHTLAIRYGTIGGIYQRVLDGEAADYVIGSTLIMPSLAEARRIDGATQVAFCRTGIGLVVPQGNAVPRMASVEDFKRALLDAKHVVYANPIGGGAAGVHVAVMIEQLGLADPIKAKTTFGKGGDVTEVSLAQGDGTVGMTQVSEILGKPGAVFVGPMPDALQNYTVFVGAVPTGGVPSAAVSAFVAFMKEPVVAAAIESRGMQAEARRP
jgi:molybdate transport system substrate-binding protein